MSADDSPIKLDVVRKNLPELHALYKRHEDAKELLTAGIDAVARESGLEKSVLKKFVTARAKDKVRAEHGKTAQLALLFENIP